MSVSMESVAALVPPGGPLYTAPPCILSFNMFDLFVFDLLCWIIIISNAFFAMLDYNNLDVTTSYLSLKDMYVSSHLTDQL